MKKKEVKNINDLYENDLMAKYLIYDIKTDKYFPNYPKRNTKKVYQSI